jgi:hypothetical protein
MMSVGRYKISKETNLKSEVHIFLKGIAYSSVVDSGYYRPRWSATCSPRYPRFAGSNPAEVGGFFQDVKILSTSPPGGTKLGVPMLRFQAL